MGEMSIRIEDDLRMKIEDLAKSHERSLAEEIDDLLRKGIEGQPKRESFADIARRIAAMTPTGVKQTDGVEMLREDRNR